VIIYLSLISIFGLAVLFCSLRKDFGEPAKRGFRGFLFLSLGISSGLPIIHLAFFPWTIHGNIANPTLINWVLGGLCYIGGCIIYINRFPEKNWPGKFCIWVFIYF
jgi:adiponectin receptor